MKNLILIIDDEKDVCTISKIMLEKIGYSVLVANNGKDGISIFNKKIKSIKVVLVDLHLPVMSGEQIIKELLKIKPEVKILILSGSRKPDILNNFNGNKNIDFLQKPFTYLLIKESVGKMLKS
jgi:two-component system, cell cycle sensor histidine kinase and response regulator CckA